LPLAAARALKIPGLDELRAICDVDPVPTCDRDSVATGFLGSKARDARLRIVGQRRFAWGEHESDSALAREFDLVELAEL